MLAHVLASACLDDIITPMRFAAAMKKVGSFIKKAYTGKFRLLAIGATVAVVLFALYFGFCFKTSPSDGPKTNYWSDVRIIAFHCICGMAFFGLVFYGVYCLAKQKMTFRKAVLLIALAGGVFVTIYGLSTPIWDYGSLWNQHDLYYASVPGRYYMPEYDVTDCGGGHFGMIMTVYRYTIIPQIKFVNGKYDFSFSGVLERYQPKLFYLVSGFFMKFIGIFVPENNGIVSVSGSTGFGLTNKEWSLFESLRLLYTMIEWLQIYFIYKIFSRLHFKKTPLLIAFTLAIFNPMWCFFANWANNDGMSTFFAIVGLYYALCYFQDGKWFQILGIAFGVGASMACKLGGAMVAIVIAPMMLFRLYTGLRATIKEGARSPGGKMPLIWYRVIQYAVFAVIVFPLGLGFPIYSKIRYGQDIFYFSPVTNDALNIANQSFLDRFVLFPNSDVFRMLWVYHSNKDAKYIQDTSLITALIKTSLYGEYGFGLSSLQCALMYVNSIVLILVMMFLIPYRFVMYVFFSDHKIKDPFRFYVISAIIVIFYGWGVYFVNSYPHTCNEDMRYIPILILGLCGMVASTYQSLDENPKVPVISKAGKASIVILTASFATFVCGGYLTMSPWYYRA